MKIKVCTCSQCRAQKKNKSRNLKNRIKRYMNKLRRTNNENKIKNYYW